MDDTQPTLTTLERARLCIDEDENLNIVQTNDWVMLAQAEALQTIADAQHLLLGQALVEMAKSLTRIADALEKAYGAVDDPGLTEKGWQQYMAWRKRMGYDA